MSFKFYWIYSKYLTFLTYTIHLYLKIFINKIKFDLYAWHLRIKILKSLIINLVKILEYQNLS